MPDALPRRAGRVRAAGLKVRSMTVFPFVPLMPVAGGAGDPRAAGARMQMRLSRAEPRTGRA